MGNILSSAKDFFTVVISYFYTVVLLFASVFSFFEVVQKPEIKTGEFDFSLVYEIDGETKTIEGTYVCEFGGIDRSFVGASRYWEGYIEGHDDSTCYTLKTVDEGTVNIELNFSAEFFMSDPDFISEDGTYELKPEPYIYVYSESFDEDNLGAEHSFGLYEGDDIKIISFEYDPPIENNYRYI